MQNTIDVILEAEQLEGTEAIVSQWLVEIGAPVAKNQAIIELETDKVAIEVTATADGILHSITAELGDKVIAGALLATLSTAADQTLPKQPLNIEMSVLPPASQSKKHLLGPAVKKLLNQHAINPASIQGTGEDGRISKKDLQLHINKLHSAEQTPLSPAQHQPVNTLSPVRANNSSFIPHTPMRRSIAKHMVDSLLQTSPHVTSVFEMDMSAIIDHRAIRKLGYFDAGINLTYTAYFIAASAIAIKQVPQINSQFHTDGLEIFEQINIGVGTALEDCGLVVPVIENVADKSLFEIAAKLTEQTEQARTRKLSSQVLKNGTFSISNYGVSGSLLATPIIINQPQVAILGVGKLEKRVTVVTLNGEDSILIKPMCYVSLSIDHRALDAYQTNAFLTKFVATIENWGLNSAEQQSA
ncbi:MAG: dehydrogenase catalytic domain-containing protein [Osedax symbiont Rs1]|nr:MAG: dehydrogenase catalytic domain-containing protein [Osedax symbiont Rs1]